MSCFGSCQYCCRKQPVLDFEHSRRQLLGGVARQHGDPGLGQHGAAIVYLVDQVYGNSSFPGAAREDRAMDSLPVHPFAAKIWKEGRMDVDDASAVGADHGGGYQLEVAGQHDEVDSMPLQQRQPFLGVRRIRQYLGRNSTGPRQLRPPASARSLMTSTTSAGAPGPSALSSDSRLLPRPEIATAIRIVMAGESNWSYEVLAMS